MYYIYKIQNLINHKKYIGLTNNIQRRRSRHFTDLKCNKHDNSFLQKEYNIYGAENFIFNIEFQGDISAEQIGEKEKYYIKFYDSYKNGYNQNEGGNFGPSNGGSHLIQSDIFNICAALEFCSRPGGVLSKMFNVSLTTISTLFSVIVSLSSDKIRKNLLAFPVMSVLPFSGISPYSILRHPSF